MKNTFGVWLWLLLLVAGVVIYAITKNAFLGAILASLRAAWPVIRSWRVIRAVDDVRWRRRVLFLFYCAAACWRAAASALISILVFILWEKMLGQQVGFDHILATLLALFGGIVITTAIGLAGILCAVLVRQQVWVNPSLFKTVSRWNKTKDESEFARPSFNYVIFIIATAVTLPSLIPGMYLLTILGAAGEPLFSLLGMAVLLLGILVGLVSYRTLTRRIVAPTPLACWPEGYFSPTP